MASSETLITLFVLFLLLITLGSKDLSCTDETKLERLTLLLDLMSFLNVNNIIFRFYYCGLLLFQFLQ